MEFLKSIFSPETTSEQWRINVRDFLRGLFVAAMTVPCGIVLNSLEQGHFCIDWTIVWKSAVAGGVAYLIKNLLTPAAPKQ